MPLVCHESHASGDTLKGTCPAESYLKSLEGQTTHFFFQTSNMYTYIIITYSSTLGCEFDLFFSFACKLLYLYVK